MKRFSEKEISHQKITQIVTVAIGNHLLAQGDLVCFLGSGEAVVAVGQNEIRGQLIQSFNK